MGEQYSVFEFASGNSNVEWGFSSFSDNSFVINTSHKEGSVIDIVNSFTFKMKTEVSHIHSHPGVDGTRGPSNMDNHFVDVYGPPMHRYIYHPTSNTWYKYSSSIVQRGYEHFNGRHTSIQVGRPTIKILKTK